MLFATLSVCLVIGRLETVLGYAGTSLTFTPDYYVICIMQ